MVTQLKIGVQNGMTNGHTIENRGSKRDDEWSHK